ncbi:MAG: DUF58 domain-containing protein [Pseudomonadota bacterium]
MTDALTLERHAAETAQRLPALLANAETLAATLMAGAHGRRRPGPGETFWQYRDYTQNDPASAIDWRQSARAPQRYFVRETEWETAATVRLWCGQSESMAYGSADVTKLWRAQILTTALALLLTKAGERIGALPSESPGSGGQRAVITLAEYLVSDGAENADPLPPLCPPGTTQAVYISDFYVPTTELVSRLKAIAASGVTCHFIALADPSEEDFPFSGRVLFQTPRGSGRSTIFGDAAAVAEDYRRTRHAHLGVMEDLCRRFGFTFIRHRTDSPATPALAQAHNAIAGQVR